MSPLEEVLKAAEGKVPVLVDWWPDKNQRGVFKRMEIQKDPIAVMSEIERRMFPDGAEARRARGERVDFERKPKDGAGGPPKSTPPSGEAPLRADSVAPSPGPTNVAPQASVAEGGLTADTDLSRDRNRTNARGAGRPDAAPVQFTQTPTPRSGSSATTARSDRGDGLARATGVRKTSLEAYAKLKVYGKLTAQQQAIVYLFLVSPAPRSRQEVAREAGLTINATCGRVKELLDLGVLSEVGRKTCTVTSSDVNALVLSNKPPEEGA